MAHSTRRSVYLRAGQEVRLACRNRRLVVGGRVHTPVHSRVGQVIFERHRRVIGRNWRQAESEVQKCSSNDAGRTQHQTNQEFLTRPKYATDTRAGAVRLPTRGQSRHKNGG